MQCNDARDYCVKTKETLDCLIESRIIRGSNRCVDALMVLKVGLNLCVWLYCSCFKINATIWFSFIIQLQPKIFFCLSVIFFFLHFLVSILSICEPRIFLQTFALKFYWRSGSQIFNDKCPVINHLPCSKNVKSRTE